MPVFKEPTHAVIIDREVARARGMKKSAKIITWEEFQKEKTQGYPDCEIRGSFAECLIHLGIFSGLIWSANLMPMNWREATLS